MMRRRADPLRAPDGRCLRDLPAWSLQPGTCWALLGPNGSGKTSLLREMGGREAPTADTPWTWQGKPLPVWHDPAWARQRASLGQRQLLTAGITVRSVIEMGAYPWGGAGRVSATIIADVIDRWQLRALMSRRWPELSGGEQQRVQLARSQLQLRLAGTGAGRLWLLDEPLAALDWPHQQLVIDACRDAAAEGAMVVVSVHDFNSARALASHSLVLGGDEVFAGEIASPSWRMALEQAFALRLAEVAHPQTGCPWLVPLR